MKQFYFLIGILVFALQILIPDQVLAQTTCVAPTGLTATNMGQTGAYLYLSSTSTNTGIFNIRYHSGETTTWTTIEHVSLPYQLGNLTCGTKYEWQAQLICANATAGTTAVSPWSAGGTFATLPCATECNTPTGLSATNVSQTGAYLYLLPTSSNTGIFNIRYHYGDNTNWTTIEHVTLPYQLGNLTCGTKYEWQAQSICLNTTVGTTAVSPWSAGSAFATLSCETPCNAPTGLSATNVSQTGAYLYLSPTLSNTGIFNIRYHSGETTTWTTIEHVSLPYQLGNLTCGTKYEWQAQLICANTTATGTTAVSPWSAGVTFATLSCETPCNAPTGLSATSMSQTGAYLYLLSTSSNTGIYNIRYHNGDNPNWTIIEHVTLPYQLGNLTCGTKYEWQAQLICANIMATGTAAVSPWSAGSAFATLPCETPCNAPTGLSATNVGQTGAYLYLSPTLSNTGVFNIRYHIDDNPNWTTIEHVTLPYQLGNLTCGTKYEWQAQLICTTIQVGPNIKVSPWSEGSTLATLPCATECNAPTGLLATNVGQSGAYLYLSPTLSNTGVFNIRYHIDDNPDWTMIEHVTLPYQLGNLTCGTKYVWQSQLICVNTTAGITAVSPWSVGSTFTTLPCATECNAPTGLSATNVGQSGAYLYLSPTSNNLGTFNIRYHAGDSTAWKMIEHVTLPYKLGELSCGKAYEWQAQLICPSTPTGAITVSPWSVGSAFATLPCATECNAPTGLLATNVGQSGAYLYLSPTLSNTGVFNIRYHIYDNPDWTMIEHFTLPYQLGNLTCGTKYVWQAQLICANTTAGTTAVSPWSAGSAFATLPCTTSCNAPTGLSAMNVSQTGAYLYLSSTSNNTGIYNIRYHAGDSTTWKMIEHVTLPYKLGELSCGKAYEWQAQLICPSTPTGAITVSQWSVGSAFTTLPCSSPVDCGIPTELSISNINQTSVVLKWEAVSGAVSYLVYYKKANTNSTEYTTLTASINMIEVSGLNEGIAYVWKVQAVCSNGTSNAVSEGTMSATAVFLTSSVMVYPNPANQLLNFSYWVNDASTTLIELRNNFGQLVYATHKESVKGVNYFTIDTTNLSDGLYFLTLQSNGNSSTSKVLVKH